MTIKLYDTDSHLCEFDAKVISCIKKDEYYFVELDRTAFFAEGGGQESDTGFLNKHEVLHVSEKDGILYHKLKSPIWENTAVHGKINWKQRFSNMQNHSGEHIVSGLVHKHFGYDNVGFHMGSDAITIDFNGPLTLDELSMIEQEANEAVYQNIRVITSYPDKATLNKLDYRSKIEIEGAVRIVEIPSIDICACCAPHVNYTGEIGLIKFLSMQKHKSGVRICMLCGERAYKDYREKNILISEISQELSAKPENTANAVSKLKSENLSLNSRIISLNNTLIDYKLAEIDDTITHIFKIESGLDNNSIRKMVNGLMEKTDKMCGVFNEGSVNENGEITFNYVIGSKTIDVRDFSKSLNETLNGKGGGSTQMVQGSLTCKKEDLIMCINLA